MEFACEKERLFDRWCTSQEVEGNYTRLCELLLIEEFKNCLPNEVKTYLDENKVETIHRAATLADNYTLTHQKVYVNPDPPVQSGQKPPGAVRSANLPVSGNRYNLRSNNRGHQSNAGEAIVHSQLLYVTTANAGAM